MTARLLAGAERLADQIKAKQAEVETTQQSIYSAEEQREEEGRKNQKEMVSAETARALAATVPVSRYTKSELPRMFGCRIVAAPSRTVGVTALLIVPHLFMK